MSRALSWRIRARLIETIERRVAWTLRELGIVASYCVQGACLIRAKGELRWADRLSRTISNRLSALSVRTKSWEQRITTAIGNYVLTEVAHVAWHALVIAWTFCEIYWAIAFLFVRDAGGHSTYVTAYGGINGTGLELGVSTIDVGLGDTGSF